MILQLKFKWFINVYIVTPFFQFDLNYLDDGNSILRLLYQFHHLCSLQYPNNPSTTNCLHVFFPELLRLEFNILHGVDHFFIYTFKEVNDVARAALLPYLSSGLATRIHFTEHPEPLIMRTRQVMNVARQSSVKLICNYILKDQPQIVYTKLFQSLYHSAGHTCI